MVQMSVLIVRVVLIDNIPYKTVSPWGLDTEAARIFHAAKPDTSSPYSVKHIFFSKLEFKLQYLSNAKLIIFFEKKDKNNQKVK